MKKLINILCVTCISVTAIAQSAVRIGSLEFSVKKTSSDTIIQIVEDPCPPCPSENETRPRNNPYKYSTNDAYCGIGFILPDNNSGYYTTLGGNSINIDIGGMRRYHLARRFALGGTLHYSYSNYKFRDAASEPEFNRLVLDEKDFSNNKINKQVYRSHSVAAGIFSRFYLIPPKYRGNDGWYIDLGAQGDFAAGRYCMLKTQSEKKKRYHEDYAFNPFSASAIVRIGWDKLLPGKSAVFVRYRFTDAFNPKALPMDLPPITIGIQFF